MKRLLSIICTASALLVGAWSCQQTEDGPLPSVDLRYRVSDSYELSARNAKSFNIVVSSTEPWYITSEHPDWCMIETEEGEASNAEDIRVGQGTKTTVKVQYYDNLQLDDRTDVITIGSGDWVGKRVTVNQKGIAYLDIPETELAPSVVKDGGEIVVNIAANQKWSVKVTEGEWLTITGEDAGENDGTVTFKATKNASWQRYATAVVYDRRGVAMHTIAFTQDGVQLDPETLEVRVGYDQASTILNVVANAKWKAVKSNEKDDWFTIENPENDGNASLKINFVANPDDKLRTTNIIIESVTDNPDDFKAQRNIVIKQAYYIAPLRQAVNNEEMSLWTSDKTNAPVYTKDYGMFFKSEARLHRSSMPFGTYTYCWKDIDPAARVRHWFVYDDSQELKFNLKAASKSVVIEFNSSGAGISGKPTGIVSSYAVDDITGSHTFTVQFDPSGESYCHVTYYFDGVEITSFDSSDSVMHEVTYGNSVDLYFGVDTGGSAVCEWYEYTAPVNWDD